MTRAARRTQTTRQQQQRAARTASKSSPLSLLPLLMLLLLLLLLSSASRQPLVPSTPPSSLRARFLDGTAAVLYPLLWAPASPAAAAALLSPAADVSAADGTIAGAAATGSAGRMCRVTVLVAPTSAPRSGNSVSGTYRDCRMHSFSHAVCTTHTPSARRPCTTAITAQVAAAAAATTHTSHQHSYDNFKPTVASHSQHTSCTFLLPATSATTCVVTPGTMLSLILWGNMEHTRGVSRKRASGGAHTGGRQRTWPPGPGFAGTAA